MSLIPSGVPSLEKETIKRVTRRIMPFLVTLYIINFLDRTNVGFAALTMNEEVGISEAVYGLGAGIFFLGYFIFEVPSNVLLHRFGARRWIARIMVTWGFVALLMAFLQTPEHFLILRVLLGIAEAGFYPGIIFYLSLWYPARYRARMIAIFYLGIPISNVIGAPLSTGLIQLGDAMGFSGWRVMYGVEAIPAIILGVVTWFFLTDRPKQAKWLAPEQADWLQGELDREEAAKSTVVETAGSKIKQIGRALLNPYVIALSLIYFGITSGSNAMNFFLPSVIGTFSETFGLEINLITNGLIVAIPYAFAAFAMVWWSRRSDVRGERRFHAGGAAIFAGVAIAAALVINHPVAIVIGFIALASGVYAAINVFWAVPSQMLTGVAAAAGIGLINSIGNLSGFTGPFFTGAMYEATGSYTAPFLIIAGVVTLAGIAFIVVMGKGRAKFSDQVIEARTTA